MEIFFTSDSAKSRRNENLHGVTFQMAEQVFSDPFVLMVEGCEDERGEMRYHPIGRLHSQVILVVVHADRSTSDEEIIHIISARKAEEYEQRAYSSQF